MVLHAHLDAPDAFVQPIAELLIGIHLVQLVFHILPQHLHVGIAFQTQLVIVLALENDVQVQQCLNNVVLHKLLTGILIPDHQSPSQLHLRELLKGIKYAKIDFTRIKHVP